ncbi:MAG: outer membrane protein assembly factor BamD [Bryobacteraceae bacterium]
MEKRVRRILAWTVLLVVMAGLLTSCFRRKRYENPITKDTQQPDKILFDKAIKDIEKGRYDVARLTLQTLISTYDSSEYLAKAKLAIADAWYRESGSHGLAQAEAEYKDFILFYPTLEEAAEAQEKVCMIHYRQMEKPDRDTLHAYRAEDECRQVLIQFPNSKFAPRVQQLLRNIQEVIAEGEYRVGVFYQTKGSFPSAANRLQVLTDHYPLFSKADDSLWRLGQTYDRMGPRFRDRSIRAYSRILREYPLSLFADEAKKELERLEAPIPEPDPVALARMKYELDNAPPPNTVLANFWGMFKKNPGTQNAAKSGTPAMTTFRPGMPLSIPAANAADASASASSTSGGGQPASDVTVSTVGDSTALDTKPDARKGNSGQSGEQAKPGETTASTADAKSKPSTEKQKKNLKKRRRR